MRKLVDLAINSINSQIDYLENNDDALDGYYNIVPDLFTYYDNEVNEKLIDIIKNNTDIDLDKTLLIENKFIDDLIYTISTSDYYFTLERNSSYWTNENELFSIGPCGDSEIQVFCNNEYQLTDLQKNYVEHKTNTVISKSFDTYFAYIELFNSISVIPCINEIIELVNNEYNDLLENNDLAA